MTIQLWWCWIENKAPPWDHTVFCLPWSRSITQPASMLLLHSAFNVRVHEREVTNRSMMIENKKR